MPQQMPQTGPHSGWPGWSPQGAWPCAAMGMPGAMGPWGGCAYGGWMQGYGQQGCMGCGGANGSASDPNRPGARVQVGEQLIGTVKSYSPTKGFGFLLHTNVAGDIWFARESLPVELRQIDLAGNQMIFELTRAPDGKPQGRALRT